MLTFPCSTLDYNIASRHSFSIDGAEVNFLNVKLICDKDLTPWCNCTGKKTRTNCPQNISISIDSNLSIP